MQDEVDEASEGPATAPSEQEIPEGDLMHSPLEDDPSKEDE